MPISHDINNLIQELTVNKTINTLNLNPEQKAKSKAILINSIKATRARNAKLVKLPGQKLSQNPYKQISSIFKLRENNANIT